MNFRKYTDLVYGNPTGLALRAKVEERWPEWEARLLESIKGRNWWQRDADIEIYAHRIFFSGVWGFGWENWHLPADGLRGAPAQLSPRGSMYQAARKAILEIRGRNEPGHHAWIVWDEQLAAESIYLPVEYAELDRWLEALLCI